MGTAEAEVRAAVEAARAAVEMVAGGKAAGVMVAVKEVVEREAGRAVVGREEGELEVEGMENSRGQRC